MVNLLDRAFSFLKSRKTSINKLVPIVLSVFFFSICLPYVFSRIPYLDNIFSNTLIAYVIRFFFLFIFAVYGTFLIIANELKIRMWLIIVLCILIILSFISNFSSPDTIEYYSLYFTGKIKLYSSAVSDRSKLTDSLRFVGGCIVCYFLFATYPYSFTDKKQFTYVLLPIVFFLVVGLLYTFTFELKVFVSMIKGYVGPESVRSIFHSKNAYGIFLFGGGVVVTYIFFNDTRWWFRILIFLLPIALVISYLINCKLAAVCLLILCFFSYFYSVIFYFKKRQWLSFLLLGLVLFVSTFIVLFFTIPQLHSTELLSKIHDKIIYGIQNISLSSFIGRVNEWTMVPIMTNGIYQWIGFSAAIGYAVVVAFTSTNEATGQGVAGLHNSFVDFYAYHGIIGCILLSIIYGYVIYNIVLLYKNNKLQSILISIVFLVSILFGMAETYTLFVSMSANTFALSFIIIVPALFYNNVERNKINYA